MLSYDNSPWLLRLLRLYEFVAIYFAGEIDFRKIDHKLDPRNPRIRGRLAAYRLSAFSDGVFATVKHSSLPDFLRYLAVIFLNTGDFVDMCNNNIWQFHSPIVS
jgi:hypothetical protein